MRLKILRLVIIALFIFIGAELFYLQAIRGQYFYNLSRNNRIRVVPIEGQRGKILDRLGVVLADNEGAYNVLIIPQETEDVDEVLGFLSQSIQVKKERLLKLYKQRKYGPFAPVLVAENISTQQAIVLEEHRFRFPGLLVQESFRRIYPFGDAVAHVIGYVGKISPEKKEEKMSYGYLAQSIVGYSGVEEFYDRYLMGHQGGLQIEVNSRGQQVRLLSIKEPTSGEDIVLTIDHRVQQMAMNVLGDKPGAIIVMDLPTGEILGLTSSPSFNPNAFIRNLVTEVSDIFNHPQHPLLNRAISGQFPPGSVFKIPVGIAGLAKNKIKEHTHFDCQGIFTVGDRGFKCTHQHGRQDIKAALAHSCNIYFYQTGVFVGADFIVRQAKLLGLGRLTGIDLPSEAKGLILNPTQRRQNRQQGWFKGDTINLSIGQGDVLTTPIQLMQMMSTIAQDGKVVQPHVIKSIGSEQVFDYNTPKYVQLHEQWTRMIKQGLRATVASPTGTAHILNLPDMSVSGKTGTAQTSGDKEDHAWFVGYSFSDKAQIAFCVFLEHGGSSYNSCLVAKELLLRMQRESMI